MSTPKEEEKKDLGEGKCVRTVCHVCHTPNLPCGEITIEGLSTTKHCTQQQQQKQKFKDKNGLNKIEERSLFKNIISANTKGRRGNEPPKKNVYVLPSIFVTAPTCHAEMFSLKVEISIAE